MEQHHHTFTELFAQLGLQNDSRAISDFIKQHAPLAANVKIADAPFWSKSQATLLREQLCDDADWAELVDQLDAALRANP
ncbi:MAG TPA: DUF2789 domain-containing protein [Burkholderiaceae bacterium]